MYAACGAVCGTLYACGIEINGRLFLLGTMAAAISYLVWEMLKKEARKILLIITFALSSVVFLFSVNYVFTDILTVRTSKCA